MSKPKPSRYRTTSWPLYNRSLERRGSMLIVLDPEMQWLAEPAGKMCRPVVFTDAAIRLRLSVEVLFKLPLREGVGMLRTLLRLAGRDWPVPDYTTLCCRQKAPAVQIRYCWADGPLNLLVDSTGIRFLGHGEWHAREHGPWLGRQLRKVYLAMDTTTSDILPVAFTSSREGDSTTLPSLLDHVPEDAQIGSVTADGVYDSRRFHTAILGHGAVAIIPIRKNGPLWREDWTAAVAQNAILRDVQQIGRADWKRRRGYHARSRKDAKMRCLKAFGESIAARDPNRKTAEIHIRVALISRFNALSTADVVRMA